jgi:hypothetical protein
LFTPSQYLPVRGVANLVCWDDGRAGILLKIKKPHGARTLNLVDFSGCSMAGCG